MSDRISTETEQWISSLGQEVEPETKMVADVRLFASDWEIKHFDGVDRDSISPLYAGQSDRVKAMKTKWYWPIVNPVYRLYANVKVRAILFSRMDKKTAFVKLKNKIHVKWKNRRSVRMRRNRAFLRSIALTPEERSRQEQRVFQNPVLISVIVPLYNTPERFLRDMIESVQKQTYRNWELCLGDGSDEEHASVGRIAMEYAEKDPRIRYRKLEKNLGISGNTNAVLSFAEGEYVALFDHDDMLHPSALFWCCDEIEKHQADFIYTDEMTFDHDNVNKIVTLHFKPGFSPLNLNGVNYICHLSVFRRSLLETNGLYDDAYDGSQDHDMVLRLTTAAKTVCHIPKVLYFWRVHPGSVSDNIEAKPYAIDSGKRAVLDNEKRLGREAEIHSSCICATHYRLDYEIKEAPVKIIITHKDAEPSLAKLLSSLVKRTEWGNFILTVADCGSEKVPVIPGIAVEEKKETETIAAFLNRLVSFSKVPYVLFLDAHMEIVDGMFLKRLQQYVMQKDIPAAASRITDRFGMVEEAGYITGLGEDGIALPIEHKNNYSAPGYMGRMYYAHNVSAASFFGMMVDREQFLTLGGFAEELDDPRYLGIDFSLKCRKAGLQVALNPYVIHISDAPLLSGYETEQGTKEARFFMHQSWDDMLSPGDPYYNPNLNRDGSFTYEM